MALTQADDRLYEQKGTLLRSRSGGRLIISRTRRMDVERADNIAEDAPGHLARHFGPEFDAALRAQYQQVVTEAQAFVAFADPESGTAVVEVGAGTGRLAIDGGLAHRVGPDGVLLLTDPAPVQLQQARQRAAAAGYETMRFLVAPAERLPLAAAGADLVIGAWFLHLCDVERALKELTRVTRPGGHVALNVPLPIAFTPLWRDILAPLRLARIEAGLPLRYPPHAPGDIPHLCEQVGLVLERVERRDLGLTLFPDDRMARQFLEQGGHLAAMSRGLSPAIQTDSVGAVLDRLTRVFSESTPEDRAIAVEAEYIRARRP